MKEFFEDTFKILFYILIVPFVLFFLYQGYMIYSFFVNKNRDEVSSFYLPNNISLFVLCFLIISFVLINKIKKSAKT